MTQTNIKYLLGPDSEHLEYTESFMPYVTPYHISTNVFGNLKMYMENIGTPLNIWDMFGGIGCDSRSILEQYPSCHLITTEYNPEIFKMLQHNLQAFNQSIWYAHNCDCVDHLKNIKMGLAPKPDIIYFDPPWGETFVSGEIFDFNNLKLPNGHMVMELFREILEICPNVVVKLPVLTDTFEIEFENQFRKVSIYRQQKLKFIFF